MSETTLPPRRRLARLALATLVVVLLGASVATALGHEPTTLGPGTVETPANGTTLVSVQGFHFKGHGNANKPARLAAAGPEAALQWRHSSSGDQGWFYDVDPLDNGNILVTSTLPGDTLVYEYDPENRERVWEQQFDAKDTHDVDQINGDQLLVANMRNYDEEAGRNDDRVFVYNRTSEEIVWEWTFREHYANDTAGGFAEDWTHVNDVDKVGDGKYLVSPRNFDQAIVVDRETDQITMRLGEDGDHGTLYEQHNPDMLVDEQGRPTFVVADSENDRVVEYTYEGGANASQVLSTPVSENEGTWNRTWMVDGFNWPRDADRLPNGNTLVTDTLNNRVVEITPDGEVVWEFYAPWAPYESERVETGDGSNGPTMAGLGTTGAATVSGGETSAGDARRSVADTAVAATEGLPGEDAVQWVANRWAHISPFVRPIWLSDWSFAYLVAALAVAVPWGAVELVTHRRRVRAGLGRAWDDAQKRFRSAD